MKMNRINFYKNRYGVIETNLIKYNKRHLTKINGERIMMKLIAEALILMLILTVGVEEVEGKKKGTLNE